MRAVLALERSLVVVVAAVFVAVAGVSTVSHDLGHNPYLPRGTAEFPTVSWYRLALIPDLRTQNLRELKRSRTLKPVTAVTLPTPASGFLASPVLSAPTLPSKTKSPGLRIRRGSVFFLDSPASCLKTLHAAAMRTLCKTTLGLLMEAIP